VRLRDATTWHMDLANRLQRRMSCHSLRHFMLCLALFAVVASIIATDSSGQNLPPPGNAKAAVIEGTVRDSAGKPVAGVAVELQGREQQQVVSKMDGTFVFSELGAGSYTLRVEKTSLYQEFSEEVAVSAGETNQIEIVLQTPSVPSSSSGAASPGGMEFEDKPDFTVAGVSNWSDLGLHGSDIKVKTSEELAKDTVALKSSGTSGDSSGSLEEKKAAEASATEGELKAAVTRSPESFEANRRLGAFYLHSREYNLAITPLEAAYKSDPHDSANADDLALAYVRGGDPAKAREEIQRMLSLTDSADLHRLLGDVEEKTGDSLGAVREYETAARKDPSEDNYFAWGTELLLHRAAEPAVEVFTKGSSTHPDSARMLAGLGAALFATGSYVQAAQRLCAASDLMPADASLYVFFGEMETATPTPLPCGDERLERFVREQPTNPLANYYYAMALLKQERAGGKLSNPQQPEDLLEKAVSINPKFGKAFLELGNLYISREDVSKAIDAYQEATAASPELSEAHYRLGLAYKRAGDNEKARQEFQEYEKAKETEAAAEEQQRRELQQFLIVLKPPAEAAPR